jgi:hypothetical protein
LLIWDPKTDSLLQALKTRQEDTNKVKILNLLSYYKNNDTALCYANEALLLSNKLNFIHGMAKAYSNKGIAFYYKNNFEQALQNYSVSIQY